MKSPNLTENQKRENEAYFINILYMLNENGAFGFKYLGESIKKKNGKFECSERAYLLISSLVSKEFMNNFKKV